MLFFAFTSSVCAVVLRCTDRSTQVDVKLVGTMHCNPASIALTRNCVKATAESGSLASVLIEACPTRWNRTLTMQPRGSLLRRLFDNEMQAAAEEAEAYGIEVPGIGHMFLAGCFSTLIVRC
jgi:hypothetical protein